MTKPTVVQLPKAQPVEPIVEFCEKLLEQARSGHLRKLFIVGLLADGDVGAAMLHEPNTRLGELFGEVSLLARQMEMREIERREGNGLGEVDE